MKIQSKATQGDRIDPYELIRTFQFSADAPMNDTQRLMLDAAAESFSETGYKATSIDTIAEKVGSTKGLIYYNYKSKPDLFFAVYAYSMEITAEFVQQVGSQAATPVDRLYDMARAHVILMMRKLPYHFVTKQGVEVHVASALSPRQREKLRAVIRQRDAYEKLFRDAIEAGVREGAFEDVDPNIAAKTLLGGLNGMSTWYRPQSSQKEADRRNIVETVVRVLVSGLLKR